MSSPDALPRKSAEIADLASRRLRGAFIQTSTETKDVKDESKVQTLGDLKYGPTEVQLDIRPDSWKRQSTALAQYVRVDSGTMRDEPPAHISTLAIVDCPEFWTKSSIRQRWIQPSIEYLSVVQDDRLDPKALKATLAGLKSSLRGVLVSVPTNTFVTWSMVRETADIAADDWKQPLCMFFRVPTTVVQAALEDKKSAAAGFAVYRDQTDQDVGWLVLSRPSTHECPKEMRQLFDGVRLMTVTVPAQSSLFFGSPTVYQIQCYLRKHRDLVVRYFSAQTAAERKLEFTGERAVDFTEPTEEIRQQLWSNAVQAALSNYERLVSARAPRRSWSKEVIWTFALERLTEFKLPIRPLTQILVPLVRQEARRRPQYKDRFQSLIDLTQAVDGCRSAAEVDKKKLLEVPFFSGMRQDVQFFSHSRDAGLYANAISDFIFEFKTTKPITGLLNLSSDDTAFQMIQRGFPFYQTKSLDGKTIEYFGEMDSKLLRFVALDAVLGYELHGLFADPGLRWDWRSAFKWSVDGDSLTFAEAISQMSEKEATQLLRQRTTPSWSGLTRWESFIIKAVQSMATGQPQLWAKFRRQQDATADEATASDHIVEDLLKADDGPETPFTVENLIRLETRLNATWIAECKRTKDDRQLAIGRLVTALGRLFRLDGIDPTSALQSINESHECTIEPVDLIVQLINVLFDWPFKRSIVSPRGLWTVCHWPLFRRLNKTDDSTVHDRISHYSIDTLLLHLLQASPLYKNQQWNGWFTEVGGVEIALVKPADFGHPDKKSYEAAFNSKNCDFSV